MFSRQLASVLTGMTINELRSRASKGLVVPEVHESRVPLYSFRDLVVLRYIAWLRHEVSLQKVGSEFMDLIVLGIMERPSTYWFGSDGVSIWVESHESEYSVDLADASLESMSVSFDELSKELLNSHGDHVVNFRQPLPSIEVDARRMGGMPTIAETRIPYLTIASLVATGEITPEEVANYYPGVSAQAALEEVAFDQQGKRAQYRSPRLQLLQSLLYWVANVG